MKSRASATTSSKVKGPTRSNRCWPGCARAHNPLSIVVAKALLLEKDDVGELARRAARIRTAAERCGRIVKRFRAMACQRRPEKSQLT
jgi:hypothetical protein